MKRKINFILISLFVANAMLLSGQTISLPSEGSKNSLGGGINGGIFLDKEAVFVGAAADYSRLLWGNWILNVSWSYDQEHSASENNGTSVTNTFSPALAIGYAFTSRLAAGIGIGKGIFDDSSTGKMQYTSEGNLTVGLLCVYTFYHKGPHAIDIGGGIERGLITPETDITIELGYGFNF